ncbi:hypothetical protein [Rhodococcus sp. Chr-9]|uniref:hypothetical protein n=1 Tax=Rhodococcus sp. Chr-9 TaxID=713612 RepID=UPI00057499F4|nr:hypothetical protein [Rhodococcus sp. Chr-9]KHJ74672.1 hypothetical protein QR64_00365 [Rhodococcus sp. Chr-9]
MTEGLLKLEHFAHWLASGERGISSEAIVSHLTGHQVGRPWAGADHPWDPDDFYRCEMLLRAYPLARLAFPAMKSRSEVWARLVDAWDELVALGEEEVPGIFSGPARGRAPRMYARMRQIREGGSE